MRSKMSDHRAGLAREALLVRGSLYSPEGDRCAGWCRCWRNLFDLFVNDLVLFIQHKAKRPTEKLASFRICAGNGRGFKSIKPKQSANAFSATLNFKWRIGCAECFVSFISQPDAVVCDDGLEPCVAFQIFDRYFDATLLHPSFLERIFDGMSRIAHGLERGLQPLSPL